MAGGFGLSSEVAATASFAGMLCKAETARSVIKVFRSRRQSRDASPDGDAPSAGTARATNSGVAVGEAANETSDSLASLPWPS